MAELAPRSVSEHPADHIEPGLIQRLFTDHPRAVNETYCRWPIGLRLVLFCARVSTGLLYHQCKRKG